MQSRLLASTSTAVAVKFGATGLRLLLLLALGVRLDPGRFAQLSLAFGLAELTRYALDFGSDAWMQRESGRRPVHTAARLAGRIVQLRAWQAVIALPLAAAIVLTTTTVGPVLACLLLAGSASQATLVFLLHRHQSVNAAAAQARPLLLLLGASAVFALAAAWNGQPQAAFAAVLTGEVLSIALLAQRAYACGVICRRGRTDGRLLKAVLARTQAFAWIALFGLIYGRVDLWLLHLLNAGADWMAHYSLAFRTLELPWILAAGVLSSLGAQLAARRRLTGRAPTAVRRMPRLLAGAALVMALYAAAAAAALYAAGRPVPLTLLAAMALLFTVKLVNIVVFAQLAASGLERRSVGITLVACALQVVLGAVCIAWLGPWGVVLSTQAVEWALLALQWRALRSAGRPRSTLEVSPSS